MDSNDLYAPKFEYQPEPTGPTFKEHALDFIQSIVVIGAIFVLIYWQIAQPNKVYGSSMVPTFTNGDYILVDKMTYKISVPKRGDVIVLKNPRNEKDNFIKRIIGLPNETVKVSDGHVYINSNLVEEKYLPQDLQTNAGNFLHEDMEVKVAPNQYLVFGDNRGASSDSREWGPITKEEIVGRVFFRYWPVQVFGLI